jgi:hypothetical protein
MLDRRFARYWMLDKSQGQMLDARYSIREELWERLSAAMIEAWPKSP